MTPTYRGIVPPMITPLTGRDSLDRDGLERLVNRLVNGGVSALFVLGTTGEAPSLSYRLRRELVKETCRIVDHRIPVLVGITDTALVESVSLAQASAEFGASAVVTSAPFYFPAGQPELREYLAQLVPELPVPLLLYNMPSLTKVSFSREVVEWAMGCEKIVGLKDSSGDLTYFRKIQYLAAKNRPDWSLLVGPEEILAETVLLGGHGGVNGGANLNPRLYVDLFEAALAGDLGNCRKLSQRVMQLSEAIYTVGQHGSAIIKGLKCALSILGVCDDFMAPPFHRFRETERALTAERLIQLGITS